MGISLGPRRDSFNSRPYESVFFCLPVAVAILIWLRRELHEVESRPAALRLVLIPAGVILLFAGGWMSYHNWRVTGHAALPPYARDARLQ